MKCLIVVSIKIMFIGFILFGYSAYADKKPEYNAADTAVYQVKYRKAAFQMIKYHFRYLGDMVKGKADFDAEKAKANADALAALSHYPIKGFQYESITEKSTSLPKIWDKESDFKEQMLSFQDAAKKLSQSTASINEMKPAFLDAAKTCKACHKAYRKKKKK